MGNWRTNRKSKQAFVLKKHSKGVLRIGSTTVKGIKIPVIRVPANLNNKQKEWIVKQVDPMNHKEVKSTRIVVVAPSYGQAVDDYLTWWNETYPKKTVGYPAVVSTLLPL